MRTLLVVLAVLFAATGCSAGKRAQGLDVCGATLSFHSGVKLIGSADSDGERAWYLAPVNDAPVPGSIDDVVDSSDGLTTDGDVTVGGVGLTNLGSLIQSSGCSARVRLYTGKAEELALLDIDDLTSRAWLVVIAVPVKDPESAIAERSDWHDRRLRWASV